jgi:PhnB protein
LYGKPLRYFFIKTYPASLETNLIHPPLNSSIMSSKIPATHQTIMPYLILANASKFVAFMKAVFNAEEANMHMRDESTIMHGELMIGNSTIMLADSTETYAPNTAGMFIYVDDADETYKKALAEGAVSKMEPSDQPYGRSCGVTDPFGNVWWITSLP